jgi:triosephosphate isomerase
MIVIGNWKMYKTAREAADYIEHLIRLTEGSPVGIRLAVPYTAISAAYQAARDSAIQIGAQNVHDAREGAFTGEIAALMLKEAGASFVLIGHSERRHLFHETDEWIHRKVVRALQDDLQPVLCIGETREERAKGKTEEVLKRQLQALADISEKESDRIILAYEPVWAIGTGESAAAKQANEAHIFCRKALSGFWSKKKAASIPILYGGSVNGKNAASFIHEKEINGILVGGASLDPQIFAAIIKKCEGAR